jgi:hypothetical protein
MPKILIPHKSLFLLINQNLAFFTKKCPTFLVEKKKLSRSEFELCDLPAAAPSQGCQMFSNKKAQFG